MSSQQTNSKSPNRDQGQEIRQTLVGGAYGSGYRPTPTLERGGSRPAVAHQRMQGVSSPVWMQQRPVGDSSEAIAQQMQSGQ